MDLDPSPTSGTFKYFGLQSPISKMEVIHLLTGCDDIWESVWQTGKQPGKSELPELEAFPWQLMQGT